MSKVGMKQVDILNHWKDVEHQISQNKETTLLNQEWRLNHLYFIIDKNAEKHVFKMNRAQKHYYENMRPRNILCKSRQLGFSTFLSILNLDTVLFTENVNALAIAHTKDDASDIFDSKVHFAINNFNDGLKNAFTFNKSSASRIQILKKDGSTSTFSVALSGRGKTPQFVHISEFAKLAKNFPERAKEVITGTFPAVPLSGRIHIESTAEGTAGEYYELYKKSVQSKNEFDREMQKFEFGERKNKPAWVSTEFYPHFYNWTYDDMEKEKIIGDQIVDVRDMELCDIDWVSYQKEHNLSDIDMSYYYIRYKQLSGDIERLNQEYPTTAEEAFISTGKPYFSARKIQNNLTNATDPETYDIAGGSVQKMHNGPLQIWRKPKERKKYIIGGDTAEGLAHGDASTLCVVNIETKEIEAIFKDNIPPDEFADIAFILAKYYNNALLAIESNKDGYWVNNEVLNKGYGNLYFRTRIDDITKQTSVTYGWRTDRQTRDTMLTEMRAYFNEYDIEQRILLDEMSTFVRNKRGKAEAMLGKHDDVIMCTAIALIVLKLMYSGAITQKEAEKSVNSVMDIAFMYKSK